MLTSSIAKHSFPEYVLVYNEHRIIEPRLTSARLSTLAKASLVYMVLVYTEWIPYAADHSTSNGFSN